MSHIADSKTDSFARRVVKLVFGKISSRFRLVDRVSPHDNESFKILRGRKPQTTKAFGTGFAASRRKVQKVASQSIRENERQDELRTLEITHKKSRESNYVSVHNPKMWKGKQGIYRLELLLYRLTHAFLICSSVKSPASLKIFGVKWSPAMVGRSAGSPKIEPRGTYLSHIIWDEANKVCIRINREGSGRHHGKAPRRPRSAYLLDI